MPAKTLEHGTLLVVAPHLQGRTSIILHGGHGPVWHGAEQTWLHSARGFRHVEVHVGIGSEHFLRDNLVLGGKKEICEEESSCLPQGQWVTREGERGHGEGVGEGG